MNSTAQFQKNALRNIIGLSVVLSMGFLLVILAGIYGNWFPIIIGLVFAVAHVPVAVTKTIGDNGDYDFNFEPSQASLGNMWRELGQFLSAMLVVTGFYLPVVLHHSHILTTAATVLTMVGGGLIYGTVYTFSLYFDDPQDEDDLPDLGGGVI